MYYKCSEIAVLLCSYHDALWLIDGGITEYAACKVSPEKIVDTNGAGDAFVGGMFFKYSNYKTKAILQVCRIN